MTNEPDNTSRRRPPTIDLTATEVGTETPAAAQNSGPDGAAANRTSRSFLGLRHHIQGAIAGVIVMGAIFAALWFAGYLPSSPPATPSSSQAVNTGAMGEISARLDKIQGALQTRQPEAALAPRIAADEATTKSLQDSLAALGRRIDEVAATAQANLAQVKSAASAAQQANGTAQNALVQAKAAASAAEQANNEAKSGIARSDLDALSGRIAALESSVKALSGNATSQAPSASPSADDRGARLTIAAEALRAAVERGVPYQAELAAVKSLGAGQDETAPLEQFAAAGVPTAAALAQQLAALIPRLQPKSGNAPDDGTYLDRLKSKAQLLVRITPINAPQGDGPSAALARLDVDAAHADIAGALADIARLPESARTAAASWAATVKARDAAIAASRQIAADALAALAKPNTQ